jgi:hypothetical protein
MNKKPPANKNAGGFFAPFDTFLQAKKLRASGPELKIKLNEKSHEVPTMT